MFGSGIQWISLMFGVSTKAIVNPPTFTSFPLFPALSIRFPCWYENMPLVRQIMSPESKASHSSPQNWKWIAAVASATRARHILFCPSTVVLPLSKMINLVSILFWAAGTMSLRRIMFSLVSFNNLQFVR